MGLKAQGGVRGKPCVACQLSWLTAHIPIMRDAARNQYIELARTDGGRARD